MFEPIQKILLDNAVSHEYSEKIIAYQILEAWKESLRNICGEYVFENTQPLHIKEKCLTVACLGPIFAQEITLRRNLLIDDINSKFQPLYGQSVVEKIRFIY